MSVDELLTDDPLTAEDFEAFSLEQTRLLDAARAELARLVLVVEGMGDVSYVPAGLDVGTAGARALIVQIDELVGGL